MTYINHTDNCCSDYFKLTHLTLFNVGAYGNNYEYTKEKFSEDSKRAESFAKMLNKPLVLVDSNIAELYTHKDIYTFALRLTIAAGILALQKLFKVYYVSSSRTIDAMKLSNKNQSFYENSITQLLSNNNTSIFITEADKNRVEKTKIVANFALATDCLYVCAADVYNSTMGTNINKDGFANCGECYKCTQTLQTLDLLGVIDNYSNIFNLDKYYKLKDDLIVDTFLWKDYNGFKNEIFNLMQSKNYKLPIELEHKYFERKSNAEFVQLQSKYKKLDVK